MLKERYNTLSKFLKEDIIYVILIVSYVILFTLQINQPPFWRYPGWDHFWVDTLTASNLISLRLAFSDFELPTLSPYINFGWNFIGDTTLTTSFLSPPNLLIMLFPPGTTIIIRTIFFLSLGTVGAYFFLKSITEEKFIAFFGGVAYISIPMATTLLYHSNMIQFFYLVPFFLLLIHRILEQGTLKNTLLFSIYSIFATSSGDVYGIIALPGVIGVYSFFIAYRFYGLGFLNSTKKAFILTSLWILSSSFYIIPFYNNISTNSVAMSSIQEASIYQPTGLSLQGFLSFFQGVGGFELLFKPLDTVTLVLYVPIFIYIAIIISTIFQKHPRQTVVVYTLILVGLTMFLESAVFFSIPSLAKTSTGLLRVQIKLIPFVNLLAGFICLAAISKSRSLRTKIFALIIIFSLIADIYLFSIPHPEPLKAEDWITYIRHHVERPFESSNRISVRFVPDMWQFLPWVNLLFVILLFLYGFYERLNHHNLKKILYPIFIMSAIIISLLSASVHTELRLQQAEWTLVTRDPYRLTSYLERKACIDQIINRYDPNYRTLYAGREIYGGHDGRNWKALAETELHVQEREKVLFPYRNTIHPYTGLLRGTFSRGFISGNIKPPLSKDVPDNIESIKFMGVKWVISMDEPIHSPELNYRGECHSDPGPMDLWPRWQGGQEGGTMFVYELAQPTGIAFMVDYYKRVNLIDSLQTIHLNTEHPWDHNIVYLETEPNNRNEFEDTSLFSNVSNLENKTKAKIIKETFNSIEVSISTPIEKYLVISYLYRPHWKAYLNNSELKIYRAYGGFMAVKVPPGQHTVQFRYYPLDVYLGLALTGLTVFIPFLFYLLWSRFWRLVRRQFLSISTRARRTTLLTILATTGIGLYSWFGSFTITHLIAEANDLFERGHYDEAITNYHKALTRGEDTPDLRRQVGEAYEAQEKWPEAITWYETWIKLAPKNAEAWWRLGWSHYQLKNYKQAQAMAIQAIEIAPDSFEAYALLGLASYYQRTDIEASLENLKRAVDLSSAANVTKLAQIYYALGRAYCQQGQSEACVTAYEKAQTLEPRGMAILTMAEQKSLNNAYTANYTKNILLDLISTDITNGETTHLTTKTGQRVRIEGNLGLVGGPWLDSQALVIQETTINLVTNSSFERSTMGWSVTSGHIMTSTTQSRYGKASLIVHPTEAQDGVLYDSTATTSPQTEYTWSVWAYSVMEDETIRLAFYDDEAGLQFQDFSLPQQTWIRLTLTKQFGSGANRYVYIESMTGNNFYIDGAQLEPNHYATNYYDSDTQHGCAKDNTLYINLTSSCEATKNLVSNSSFETDMNGWSVTAGKIERSTSQSYQGTASLWVKPSQAADGAISDVTATTSAFTEYILSAWVYAPNDSETTIRLLFYDSGAGVQAQEFLAPIKTWTPLKLAKSFGSDSDRFIYITSVTGNNFYLDAVQLTPKPIKSINRVSISKPVNLNLTGAHTLLMWYRIVDWPEAGSAISPTLFAYGNYNTENNLVLMHSVVGGTEDVGLWSRDANGNWRPLGLLSGIEANDGKWHLAGYAFDGKGNIQTFFDEKFQVNMIDSWPGGDNTDDTLYIGSRHDGSHALGGAVARVTVFDRDLLVNELRALYQTSNQ